MTTSLFYATRHMGMCHHPQLDRLAPVLAHSGNSINLFYQKIIKKNLKNKRKIKSPLENN